MKGNQLDPRTRSTKAVVRAVRVAASSGSNFSTRAKSGEPSIDGSLKQKNKYQSGICASHQNCSILQ
jgi:hypothetical protein